MPPRCCLPHPGVGAQLLTPSSTSRPLPDLLGLSEEQLLKQMQALFYKNSQPPPSWTLGYHLCRDVGDPYYRQHQIIEKMLEEEAHLLRLLSMLGNAGFSCENVQKIAYERIEILNNGSLVLS